MSKAKSGGSFCHLFSPPSSCSPLWGPWASQRTQGMKGTALPTFWDSEGTRFSSHSSHLPLDAQGARL